jgi:predicted glycoside hydrolase/deacetylase ChbG (UPF0249 family)
MLIVNADDLGRAKEATDNILLCHGAKRVSSTSAMVYMQDSERAASLALLAGIDLGLHINFSEELSGDDVPAQVRNCHRNIRRFLSASKYAVLVFNPFLTRQFRYVFDAQLAEFLRLYGRDPSHFDGHQHMHLACNMLFQRIMPEGAKTRRSFSFLRSEKSFVNRWYRAAVDRSLSRRHRIADHFFSLAPRMSVERLHPVVALATSANVELMVHPQIPAECSFLMSEGFGALVSRTRMAGYDAL